MKRPYDAVFLTADDDRIKSPRPTSRPRTPVPVLDHMVNRCFRIRNIPHGWTETQVLALERLNVSLSGDDTLALFPALDGSNSKVGLLSLTRSPTFNWDLLAPNTRDRPDKLICPKYHVTIDRFFEGMTPMNTPKVEPLIEYVVCHFR